jgi:hypothetical protein
LQKKDDDNSDLESKGCFIHPDKLLKKDSRIDHLTTIIKNTLKESGRQVGVDQAEAESLVEKHSWYKYFSGYIIVKLRIDINYLGERISEAAVYSNRLNASDQEFFYLKPNISITKENILGFNRILPIPQLDSIPKDILHEFKPLTKLYFEQNAIFSLPLLILEKQKSQIQGISMFNRPSAEPSSLLIENPVEGQSKEKSGSLSMS